MSEKWCEDNPRAFQLLCRLREKYFKLLSEINSVLTDLGFKETTVFIDYWTKQWKEIS